MYRAGARSDWSTGTCVSARATPRPQDGVACLQRLLIEVSHRQVQPRQVVEDEDPAREQWNQQREQQRGTAGRDKSAKLGRVPRGMSVARLAGLRYA